MGIADGIASALSMASAAETSRRLSVLSQSGTSLEPPPGVQGENLPDLKSLLESNKSHQSESTFDWKKQGLAGAVKKYLGNAKSKKAPEPKMLGILEQLKKSKSGASASQMEMSAMSPRPPSITSVRSVNSSRGMADAPMTNDDFSRGGSRLSTRSLSTPLGQPIPEEEVEQAVSRLEDRDTSEV